MSFPKYGDVLKSVSDLFKKDFVKKDGAPVTFEMSADAPAGVTVTSTSSFDHSKDGAAIDTYVSAKWAHPSGFTLDKLEFNPSAKGSIVTETSLTGLAEGLKLDFKGNDNDKGDVSFTYKHPHGTVHGGVDIMNFKSFGVACVTGMDNFVAGVQTSVNKGKDGFSTKVNTTASYQLNKIFAGVDVADNFSKYGVLMSFSADKNTVAAVRADMAAGGNVGVQVGASYKCNPSTTLKTKVDVNKQAVDFSVKQSFDKNFNVTGFAQVSSFSVKSMLFGCKATLG